MKQHLIKKLNYFLVQQSQEELHHKKNLLVYVVLELLEYDSGVSGNTDEFVYKAFIFDVRTFTVLTLSDTPSPLLTATHSSGVRLTGNTSGATGLVFDTDTSGPLIIEFV